MSSHHIVREKQEPALLILSLRGFSSEYLGQLLEWSPTVIATADSFDELISEGIKVDWLIGEEASIDLQGDIKIISSKPSDTLNTALNELIVKGYSAVNIIAEDDDISAYEDIIDKINIVIYTPTEKIYAVKPAYQKWLPAGDVIIIKGEAKNLKVSGAVATGDDQYQTTSDGMVTLNFDNGHLFVAELL